MALAVHAHFSPSDFSSEGRSPNPPSLVMAYARCSCRLISLFLLISFVSTAFAGVPVLLWESSNISEKEDVIPALDQLDGDEFSNHLVKKVHTHKPLIVVFVEETLSVEDFSWKDDKRQGAFPKLENITGMASKMEFIPSVIDPVDALKDLVHSQGYSYLKFDRVNPKNKPGTALEVALSDPFVNEDRPQLLRRHDADITRIYSNLLASAPRIVAIFTGRQNSWVEADVNRVRREAQEDSELQWKTGMAMLTARSANLTVENQTFELTQPDDVKTDDRKDAHRIIATYSKTTKDGQPAKIVVRLKFSYDKSQWGISDSEVEVGGTPIIVAPKTKVSAPLGQSFSADELILESPNKDASLIFQELQGILPPIDDNLRLRRAVETEQLEKFKKAGQMEFSDASSDGNQFFTPAIWMGLLVTWTMLIILGLGLTMLMDIKTMDRFDDPKGKTITVNVNE